MGYTHYWNYVPSRIKDTEVLRKKFKRASKQIKKFAEFVSKNESNLIHHLFWNETNFSKFWNRTNFFMNLKPNFSLTLSDEMLVQIGPYNPLVKTTVDEM